MRKNYRLGDILLDSGKITREQLEIAINKHNSIKNKKLGEILIELGYVSEEDILDLLKKQLDIPIVDLSHYYIDPKIIALVPESIARKYN